jgi:hypothetical protein
MNPPFEDEENTPTGNNVIPINGKEFIIDTNLRMSDNDRRIYNLSEDMNLVLNKHIPIMNSKLDRILDSQREINKSLMNQPKTPNLTYLWSGIGFIVLVITYLLFK